MTDQHIEKKDEASEMEYVPFVDKNWAKPVSRLKSGEMPAEAVNLNVNGRQVTSPLQGFGPLWEVTYSTRLSGSQHSPAEVVKTWKERFNDFQPASNKFYASKAGVKPGEVMLINATVSSMPVSTGMLVIYEDETTFTLMTPEGHPLSGWNTFSAYEDDGSTVLEIKSIYRTTDPIFEFGFRFMGGNAQQEKIWPHVLTSLAQVYGVRAQVKITKTCVDPRMQWSRAKNVWHNAMIRSFFYGLAAPVRWVKKAVKR